MKVELYCSSCPCRFAAPPETRADEILDLMRAEGPWYALGDGETFEDMIFSTLTRYGNIRCPQCGEPVSVSEETLGEWTQGILAQW